MVDLQRVRSMAMLEASANVVPSCFRYLPKTSPHRALGAPRGLDNPSALGLKVFLRRFNKTAIPGTPQMAVDKEAISLSRVYSYYSKCSLPLFYV